MKLRLKTTFLALAVLQLSLAQQINGTWNGKLNVQGQEIPLVFHFVENKKEIEFTFKNEDKLKEHHLKRINKSERDFKKGVIAFFDDVF